MVWPRAARQDMWSMMFSAAKASRPVVGSSKNMMLGLAISEHDMLSRRFSPPAPNMTNAGACMLPKPCGKYSADETR